jgi:hypothetical protein
MRNVRVLITTRSQHVKTLQTEFTSSQIIEVRGDISDIEKYLVKRLEDEELEMPLTKAIMNTLLKANEGETWYPTAYTFLNWVRFLLVTLQTDYILEAKDPLEINERLKSLPTDLTHAYRDALEQMSPRNRAFARRIYGWILHAQRLLTIRELCEALVVKPGDQEVNFELMISPKSILQTCGCLVTYDPQTDLVRFSHETVRAFLTSDELEHFPSHLDISKVCITYLGINELEYMCSFQLGLDKRREKFGFSTYAASFWAIHALSATGIRRDIELEVSILEMLQSNGRRSSLAQLRSSVDNWHYQTLLHTLIENRLAFIVISPLFNTAFVAGMCMARAIKLTCGR